MPAFAVSGYQLSQGTVRDRDRLLQFLTLTYQEMGQARETLHPGRHLTDLLDLHLAPSTPIWWVKANADAEPVACLWLGTALDPRQGRTHSHVLLLYVKPLHRRRGIATALMHHAEGWAAQRGDRQIELQVFAHNAAAIGLYTRLGYGTEALWMTKPLP